jgi:hypothetical protein
VWLFPGFLFLIQFLPWFDSHPFLVLILVIVPAMTYCLRSAAVPVKAGTMSRAQPPMAALAPLSGMRVDMNACLGPLQPVARAAEVEDQLIAVISACPETSRTLSPTPSPSSSPASGDT